MPDTQRCKASVSANPTTARTAGTSWPAGNTNIRAYTGVMTDPPLPADAVRTVLRGDFATAR